MSKQKQNENYYVAVLMIAILLGLIYFAYNILDLLFKSLLKH